MGATVVVAIGYDVWAAVDAYHTAERTNAAQKASVTP
jgi:hypothetical protein